MSDEQGPSKLAAEIEAIRAHKYLRAHNSWLGLIWFNLVRGLAFGFGSVIGATVLVSVAVYFLAQVDFIPILGDYAARVMEMIEAGK